ncbi:MAG TPA: S41 family peptidase [Sphingobacteriaceae bacterium]
MNKNLFLLSASFVVFCATGANAQIPDSVKLHVDSAINLLQDKSIYAKRVNWEKIKAESHSRAASARTKAETFDAIQYAFLQLKDKHGMFVQYDKQYRVADTLLPKRYSDSLLALWKGGWKIQTEMLGEVAYIHMPNMNAFNREQIDKMANRFYDSVAALAAQKPKAWIIDLRRNAGGNNRPMMAGIAPFFGDGPTSYILDRDNNIVGTSGFRGGDYVGDEGIEATIRNKIPAMADARIAVIIGPGTGSSGEGVAFALKERKNTRLFGEPSAGYANSTEGFVFNNQNSYFLLTTSLLSGKDKKVLPEQVLPDVEVKHNDHFDDLKNDNAVKAALAWLKH